MQQILLIQNLLRSKHKKPMLKPLNLKRQKIMKRKVMILINRRVIPKMAKNSMKVSHGMLIESSHICLRLTLEQI